MKKGIIGMLLFIVVFSAIIVYGTNRIEKINNGEMTLVNQNQMDR